MKEVERSRVSEIRSLYQQIEANTIAYVKANLPRAIRIGELLTEQKKELKHGQWLPWLKENLSEISVKTVERWMKLYRERDRIKIDNVSNLSEAYRLLEEPKKPIPVKIETWDEFSECIQIYKDAKSDLGKAHERMAIAQRKFGGVFAALEEVKTVKDFKKLNEIIDLQPAIIEVMMRARASSGRFLRGKEPPEKIDFIQDDKRLISSVCEYTEKQKQENRQRLKQELSSIIKDEKLLEEYLDRPDRTWFVHKHIEGFWDVLSVLLVGDDEHCVSNIEWENGDGPIDWIKKEYREKVTNDVLEWLGMEESSYRFNDGERWFVFVKKDSELKEYYSSMANQSA